jgi:hypothetical protein
MTPIERAETALNSRIARIQTNLRAAKSEATQQFLVQALVVCVGIGEALTEYVRTIGEFARGRHAELKRTHDTLTAEHAQLLTSGQELLERLKANPKDLVIRKEIEVVQRKMADIQKTLKRGANALQRETAPSVAMIDKLAVSIRRLAEADQIDALKRATKQILEHAHELYRAQPNLPAKNVIDVTVWEKSAVAEIGHATDFHEAYARAGYQAILALDVMTMALSPTPPRTPEEATERANTSAASRLKTITARFANN